MAKITPGALVGEIRNALGGMVFSRNTYGAFIRNNTVPVNPNTTAQDTVRSRFAYYAGLWRTLTSAQREEWNTTAQASFTQTDVFGSSFQLTGFNLFMKLNSSLGAVGTTTVLNAPLEVSPEGIVGIINSFSVDAMGDGTMETTIQFSGGGTTVPTGYTLILQATSPLSAGRNYAESFFKQIGTAAASTDISSYDILGSYEGVFGDLSTDDVGGKIFLRGQLVNATTGQRNVAVAQPSSVALTA